MLRYFLQITYLGTYYHGWQIQHNAPSIQQEIERCMCKILQKKTIKLVGSSRTDKGVHAQEQYAHVDLDEEVNIKKLRYQLNALLPSCISITAIRLVQYGVHARFDALFRIYEYVIVKEKSPFLDQVSYLLRNVPLIEKMNYAAACLCREMDFRSFSKKCKHKKNVQEASSTICRVVQAFWYEENEKIIFKIKANRFLRGMVRIIVSILLKVGHGTISLSSLESMFTNYNHEIPCTLVPACGLTLKKVIYPDAIFLSV